MATPEEIKKLLDQINKAYEKLGDRKNPFAKFDTSNIKDAKATIEQLEVALEAVQTRIENSQSSFKDLSDTLREVVKEINPKAVNSTKDFANGFKNIIKEAKKLQYEEEGINKLSKKQLEQVKERVLKQQIETKEVAKRLLNEAGINEKIDKRTKTYKNLNDAEKAAVNYLRDESTQIDTILDKTSQRIAQEEKIEKLMGLGGAAVEGTQKALEKMGFGGLGRALGLDEVKEKMREIAEGIEKAGGNANSFANKFEVLKGGIKEAGNQLKTSLKDPLAVTGFLVDQMMDALNKADKETGELAKAFGTSYSEAAGLRDELNTMANLSGDVNITTSALQKSLIAVNKEFKTATMFGAELLEDFTNLTEVAGYTNEAAQRFSKISVATGTDLSDNTAKILGTAKAFNITNKLALNEKEIVEEVAKASKATTLSLGMQPDKLAKAVLQAKALGSSLEKVESISQSLLNFESSISSELEAELLTGKNLNLERARMYALNNDIEGVAREIAGQIGKASDFTKMNVIQQEALAKSVGMTREDLASSLIEREALSKIGDNDKTALEAYNRLKKEGLSDDEIAVKLGDEQLANQLKSQSVQERFNASVEKLKEIFISLAGPILQIVSPFMDLVTNILPLINVILTPVTWTIGKIGEGLGIMVGFLTQAQDVAAVLVGTFGAILAYQNRSNIATAAGLVLEKANLLFKKREAGVTLGQAALGAIKSVVETPIVGPLLAAAAAAGVYALGKSYLTKGDDVISPGYGKRTLLMGKDAISLNDNDTVIAGTNLGGKKSSSTISSDMSRVEALLSQLIQKQDRPVHVSVEMDGEKVAKGVGNNSTKLGTSMSTNTYKIQ